MASIPEAPGVAPDAPTAWQRPAARWILPAPGNAQAEVLRGALHLSPLLARVLAQRGFDAAAAERFLSPGLDGLHDPFLMRDMDRAVVRLWRAVQAREPVLLYGDYDVDGTSSVVVLKKAIEILGGCASFHIPHRLQDGYGMRSEVIDHAAGEGVRLIVSLDTGIRASEVVRHAQAIGIDVIVTDHHLPERELPPALAVLNPNRRDCEYPNKHLCGAGVAFKLVQALLRHSGMPEARQTALLDSFLKPVAIATVADIVPLTGENRVLVQRGLSGMRQVRNVGLRALMTVAGLDEGEPPSAHQVAFRLAPRINAAGRMATAKDVIELFLTKDAGRAKEIAESLDALNRERQRVEKEIVETILKQCEARAASGSLDQAAFVFAGDGWHLGVLGIVASRLVERLCRPVFVLSESSSTDASLGPHLAGSGRSIAGFHLLEALESMAELFAKFGGHRQAAGVTLPSAGLDEFQRRFHEHAAHLLTEDDMRPTFIADAEASFPEFTDAGAEQLQRLGPFGFGNTAPLFHVRGAEVAGPIRVLTEGKHYTIPIRHAGRMLFTKAWNFGGREELFQPGSKLDLLVQLEDDLFSKKRGYSPWCVVLKDVRQASIEPSK
jgi:single-stranded-DNA-specific exonuclease